MTTKLKFWTVLVLAIAAIFTFRTVQADQTKDVTINTTDQFGVDPAGAGVFDRELMMKGDKAAQQTVHPKSSKVLQGIVNRVPVVQEDLTIANNLSKKVATAESVARGQPSILIRVSGTFVGTGPGQGTGVSQWDTRYFRQPLPIYYIGGTSNTDGTQEGEKELANNYILKGYILKCVCPGISQGTQVTWTFKKGDQEVGTFHDGYAWTNYSATVTKGTGAIIYWRSDTEGDISDQYVVEAKYTPQQGKAPITVTRTLTSRKLDPTNGDMRDYFNEDVDMLQRVLIQVFFLDKGRLDSYTIGKYRDNSQEGYLYHSSLQGRKFPFWSAVADEIENFDRFTLNQKSPSKILLLRQMAGIWNEFSLIALAGEMGEIAPTNPNMPKWVNDAIKASDLQSAIPDGFAKQANDILQSMIVAEGRFHSYKRHAPLAYSSVSIGEQHGGKIEHTWTDGGLGFGKIQPYNRGANNLYKPDENLNCMATFFKPLIQNAPGIDANQKVWRAVYRYNHGSYDADKTIAQLRTSTDKLEVQSAGYADKVFSEMGVVLP